MFLKYLILNKFHKSLNCLEFMLYQYILRIKNKFGKSLPFQHLILCVLNIFLSIWYIFYSCLYMFSLAQAFNFKTSLQSMLL